MRGSGLIWTIVGVLAIMALLISFSEQSREATGMAKVRQRTRWFESTIPTRHGGRRPSCRQRRNFYLNASIIRRHMLRFHQEISCFLS